MFAEHNGTTGAVLTDYVYSGSRMIGKIASGSAQYFLSDRLSKRLVLDSSGNVIGHQGHLPFGQDFGESGTQEKHHFMSYDRDSESGLDYGLNRGYEPNLGRFQQADPYRSSGHLVDPQSWNRYPYARNDSINRLDPLGLDDTIVLRNWDRYGFSYSMDVNASLGGGRGSSSGAGMGDDQLSGVADGTSETGEIDTATPIAAGKLTVDENCGDSVLYVKEGEVTKKSDPKVGWYGAGRVSNADADFIATARGVVKIPDGCNCSVSCTGGDDYKITCECGLISSLLYTPSVMEEKDFESGVVSNPKLVKEWNWVNERAHYSANTSGGTTVFN